MLFRSPSFAKTCTSRQMNDFFQRRKRILALCEERQNDIRTRGMEEWGPALGVADVIMEDALLLLELKERLDEENWRWLIRKLTEGDGMATLKEQDLYFAARNRALERHVETNALQEELEEGFSRGLAAANPSYAGSEAYDPTKYMDRIKTETNFGFGFVLGVMARLEAIKALTILSESITLLR